MKIGYLGPNESTFGYMAAEKFFDQVKKTEGLETGFEFTPYKNHNEVCYAIGSKEVKYGVIAVENVIDGVVAETIRAVDNIDGQFGLKVCAEVIIPIELFYMKKENSGVLPKKLLSHVVALRQCSHFVSNLQADGVAIELRDSTGAAAQEASTNSDIAVIASNNAAKLYNLQILNQESVTDHKNSLTRFWIIGKEHANKTGKDKTCFLINLEQSVSGSLWKALGVFAERNINLLLIYPCPIPGKHWEYTFLIELRGYITDPGIMEAWSEFRKLGLSLNPPRFIGSYPDVTSQ